MTRRQRLLLSFCAHLALLGLVLQAFAFDHISAAEPPIPGSAEYGFHLNHCHGGASGCAGQGSDAGLIVEDATLAITTADWQSFAVTPDETRFVQAFIPTPHQPPRNQGA